MKQVAPHIRKIYQPNIRLKSVGYVCQDGHQYTQGKMLHTLAPLLSASKENLYKRTPTMHGATDNTTR